MELKERLKQIMEQEFGITTAEQLDEAIENMDMSAYSIFAPQGKGNKNEA